MTIRHGEAILAAFFLAAGLYCIAIGTQFNYYNRLGPGAGFFPIWIGLLLTLLSAGLLIQVARRWRTETAPFFADRSAGFRVCGTLAFVAVASAAMSLFGFRLTMFVFAALAPFVIKRMNLLLVGTVAVAVSFGVAYAFETWLRVQLPKSSIDALRSLGL